MFQSNRILVVGSGIIAEKIHAELAAAGRRVEQVDDPDRAISGLRKTSTLIIADPTTDASGLIDRIAALYQRRLARHAPLRLILVGANDDAPDAAAVPEGVNLTIETFDPEEQAARSLLARWPLHSCMDPPHGQVPHILIAGFAVPARALLVQAMRLVHYGDESPVVTLADENPKALRNQITESFPQAGQLCRLRFTGMDEPDLTGTPPVTSAYICMASPERGLDVARRIAERIADQQRASPLVHLEIGDTQAKGRLEDWDGQLVPFSWLHEAFSPAVLLDGLGDELAMVIHEHYQDSIAAQGRDPNAEPAGRSWDNLDASYRDASRHQSDHLPAKLATLDCRAVREELVESFTFAPLEAEKLAIIEHKRWAADRYLDGWTYAPQRDNARKHHPQLIPYDDLSEPMKDLDRFAVRLAPTLLARSGRGLIRMLLVAIAEPQEESPADHALKRLARETLQRLTTRYPDRSLVLASTLESAASKKVVRLALDEFETALFLLCPRPLGETLATGEQDRERYEMLELAARAERRIGLSSEGALEAWIAERAEVELLLDGSADAGACEKQVRLDLGSDCLDWSFEY